MKIFKFVIAIAIAFLFVTAKSPQRSEKTFGSNCLEADILFVTDWSGSIVGFESITIHALSAFVSDFDVSARGVKIGIMSFDDHPVLYSPITSDPSVLYFALDTLSKRRGGGDTYIEPPLKNSQKLFDESTSERNILGQSKVVQFLILISDGDASNNSDQDLAEKAAEKLKKNGVIICTIGIGNMNDYDRASMKKMASEEYYFETDYTVLEDALQKMGAKMCM